VAPPGPNELRRPPLGATSSNPAPFVAGSPAPDGPPSDPSASPETPATPQGNEIQTHSSAASMATEILSAAPRAAEPEPAVANKPTTMAEDVTIMAKGRRRRFRLR
jgi:hypothetical protein